MTSRRSPIAFLLLILALFSGATHAQADDQVLKPYVLGSIVPNTLESKFEEVKSALGQQGFQVAGHYAPYKGTKVLVVTSEALRNSAAKSAFGAYGAMVRVSLAESAQGIQVAYTNPRYFSPAYRMSDSLADVAGALEKALGKKSEFGSAKGLTAGKLRDYHYMMMMPYFTDQVKLASHSSHEAALKAVEANLAARKGGSSLVYRIDLPGKKESVFGVAISEGEGADEAIMKTIDFGDPKQVAHLPYEIVVADGSVYMLHGKFRIALDFPDLTMGTFMKISGAPSAIEEKLRLVAGGN